MTRGRVTMQTGWRALLAAACLLAFAGAAGAQTKALRCPPDSVAVGPLCVDKYEASVWRFASAIGLDLPLIAKIQRGTALTSDLVGEPRATQLGTQDNYSPCEDNGQQCSAGDNEDNIFAVSIPGVTPSANITWFQAQQACKNARKRLLTSAEWQAAVAGTPDPGPDDGSTDCNTASTGAATPAGSREACVSAAGAFDMVGNLAEWVADWVPLSELPEDEPCGSWPNGDAQCLNGDRVTTGTPGVLQRGGSFRSGTTAGPLAIFDALPSATTTTTTTSTTTTTLDPSTTTTVTTSTTTTTTFPRFGDVGFRCVR